MSTFIEDPRYDGMELSTRILIQGAEERGIEVEVLDREDQFIRLKKDGLVEYVKQATRTSADRYIAPLIMENKYVTKRVLSEHGINVPEGARVHSPEEALAACARYRDLDIVIKPNSTNYGLGVSILSKERTVDAEEQAVALAFAHDDIVLVEQFVTGREYRFLVIGDDTVAVLYRVPANVTGDGKRTIKQLVQRKNEDPLRGEGYVRPLEKIRLGREEERYLSAQGKTFETVPLEGEVVYLRENSNISTGGDSIDCTDEMNDGYKQIAVRAAQAVGARICGADIIVPDLHADPEAGGYAVIELNFNPALHIHNYPYKGKNRRVEQKVLDLLGFSSRYIT